MQLRVIATVALVLSLTNGCAAGTRSTVQSLPPESTTLQEQHTQAASAATRYHGLQDLYVTEWGKNVVRLLKNGSYDPDGTITAGLSEPVGDWLDNKGNFYVANRQGPNITEYKPDATSPTYTYSAGMSAPSAVATDDSGNVFEADIGGVVNEYAHRTNTVSFSCSPPYLSPLEGVAVDKAGDVFILYGATSFYTGLSEFKGGLDGCHRTDLAIPVDYAGGIAVDRDNDLIICEQLGQTVDVIAPPYNSVTRRWYGYKDPFQVTLSADNKLAFVADRGSIPGALGHPAAAPKFKEGAAVYVVDFQSGKILKKLGRSNGLSKPAGAVDGPNAVY